MDRDKTKQLTNKSLLFLAKGAGKGQLNKTENFQTVTTPAKHLRKNWPHIPCKEQRLNREPKLPPLQDYNLAFH